MTRKAKGSSRVREPQERSPSSWRWNDRAEFEEYVNPLHINEVDHVRQSGTIFSWSKSLEQYFESLRAFGDAVYEADRLLKNSAGKKALFKPMNEYMLDIGHHGEMILLYRKRLALASEARDFIHDKQFIQHGAHQLSRPSHAHELERVVRAASKLYAFLREDNVSSDAFIIDRVPDLPHYLKDDYYAARDLFSVGFDELGLFAVGRGLERVSREILRLRRVSLERKGVASPAHEGSIYDIVEVLGQLRWKSDSELLVPSATKKLLHWLRDIRNHGAHVGSMRELNSYELAPVVADAANNLWRVHTKNARRPLMYLTIRKTWA